MLRALKLTSSSRQSIFLILSIILAVIGGVFFPDLVVKTAWIGKIFINALMLLIFPLIFCALFSAILNIKDFHQLKYFGTKTFAFILGNLLVASAIGLIAGLLFRPGQGIPLPDIFLSEKDQNSSTLQMVDFSFLDFIFKMFPDNLLRVSANGEILPLVVFGLFFSLTTMFYRQKNDLSLMVGFFDQVRGVLQVMITILLKFTPIALFCLVGAALSKSMLEGNFDEHTQSLMGFIFVFLLSSFFLAVVQYAFLMLFLPKKIRWSFLKDSLSLLFTAFGTGSSIATLPMMMNCAESNLQVRSEVSRLVLPLTVIFNLGSSALYIALASLFLSQMFSVDLSWGQILSIYISSVILGFGTTGIPNAGFIATITVVGLFGVPAESVLVLFPLDIILSRVRTSANIWGDVVCASYVSLTTGNTFRKKTGSRPKNN